MIAREYAPIRAEYYWPHEFGLWGKLRIITLMEAPEAAATEFIGAASNSEPRAEAEHVSPKLLRIRAALKAGRRLQLLTIVASFASLALVSYIDWVTGYEGLFFIFYFVPVALCAWRLGQAATLGVAGIATVSWVLTDRLSGHIYSHTWLQYWNGVICFLALAILGLVMHRWQRSLREQRKAREELAKALEELRRSAEEVSKLQSQLQVVCAWTKRIRIDGSWIPLDQFLANKLHVPISHGISPEAFEQVRKSLNETLNQT